MTPNEHDEQAKSAELPTTELYPFARVTPGGLDDTMPDLPVMEQLPDSQALPDPGYPEMPASPRGHAGGAAPPVPPIPSAGPPEPLAPQEAPEALAPQEAPEPLAPQEAPWPAHGPADGPSARAWPRPP